jgi:hypothetical protein
LLVISNLGDNHRHAVLALSSLHIAYLRPAISDRYLILAAQHQGLAFPLIRSALTGVDEDNCHAIYAFGQVIAIYAIAIPQEPESQAGSSVIGTGLGFVPLLRSTFSMCDFALEWLSVGPFSSCLEKSPNLDDAPEFSQNPDDGKYARLLPFLRDNGSKDAHTCCKALNSLRGLLAIATAPNQSIDLKTLIFSWPAQVPQRYIFLIFKKNPGALVVMAHYCVMLNMIGSFWFMKGRAARLLEHCRNNLSDEWVHHVDWPLSIVGLPQDKQSMITI